MADGISKLLIAKKETVWGTKATASSAQLYPRTQGVFQISKGSYQSNNIRASQQLGDSRHASSVAKGSLSADLQCGAFSQFMAAMMRKDFASTVTTGAVITISIAAANPSIVRSSGSFITDGFKVGMLLSPTGIAATADNALAVITAVAALNMTVFKLNGSAYTTAAAGASITIVAKKSSFTPQTAHTDDSFTVEEFLADISTSFITRGQQVNSLSIDAKPNSMATIALDFMGKDGDASTGSQYFTSPTAVPSTGNMSGSSGQLIIGGAVNSRVTSFNIKCDAGISQEFTVFTAGAGAKSRGQMLVSGSISFILDDGVLADSFTNETETNMFYTFTDTQGNALTFAMPRAKLNDVQRDDKLGVTTLTASFVALEYIGTDSGTLPTTLIITDSTL